MRAQASQGEEGLAVAGSGKMPRLSRRDRRPFPRTTLTAVVTIATLDFAGTRLRVTELALACCAVESAYTWSVLADATEPVRGWTMDALDSAQSSPLSKSRDDRDDAEPLEVLEPLEPPDDRDDAEPLEVLVVSGTVTLANVDDVRAAYETLASGARDRGAPAPRVVALGVCAISGGPFWDSYAVVPGIADLMPVHISVPGCPPRPEAILDALGELVKIELEPAATSSHETKRDV